MSTIVMEVHRTEMLNQQYYVEVRRGCWHGYQIFLCHRDGMVLREMQTTRRLTMTMVVSELRETSEPEDVVSHYETDATCKKPGGRIRLDDWVKP